MGAGLMGRLTGTRRVVLLVATVVAVVGGLLVLMPSMRADAAPLSSESVASASANEDSGTITFTVTASGLFLTPDTVHYATSDGTAKAGEDYTATSGDLTFTASGTKTITVPIKSDTEIEPNETFTVTLTGDTASGGPATGTIVNDDFAVSVADTSLNEGNSGTTNAHLVISLQGGARSADTTVQYATVDGTARAGSDYTAKGPATATIPAGQTSTTIDVPVSGDALYEDNETFRFVITNPSSGVTLGDDDATVTIINDDPVPEGSQQPKISIADKSFTEGNSGVSDGNFVLSLSGQVPYTVTVRAATTDATAKSPDDYTAVSNALVTFPPGTTTQNLPVSIKGDALDEFDETFKVTLSNASPGASINDAEAIGTITDDDATPTLTVDNATGNEGSKLTFTIRLSTASGRATNVAVATVDGTAKAPGDYDAVANTTRVNIPAGATSATFDVQTKADSIDEPDETFGLGASQQKNENPNPTSSDFTAPVFGTGTIKDATADPSLSINDVAKDEGNAGTTAFTFTVTLSAPSDQTVTVNYATAGDTATSAADFTPASGSLSFAPQQTSKTVTVNVVGDAIPEADETFKVTLTSPAHAVLGDGVGVGTIRNDDGAVSLTDLITTGAGPGGGSHVKLLDADGQSQGPGFFATVNGPGVRVARGDLDGDGHDEIIAASGAGGPSLVRVFNVNGGLVAEIDAYPGFTGGVMVAAGDVDKDGKDEVITGAGPGGGPHVRVFKLTGDPGNRELVGNAGFYGFDDHLGPAPGVSVAAGDTDGDGRAEIVVAPMSKMPPFVVVWKYNFDNNQPTLVGDPFLAYAFGFHGGVDVAVGDLDGDNKAEIVTGAGPGGAPHVRVFSASGGGLPGSAYAYGEGFSGGVHVAVGDVDGDGTNDIITAPGTGGGPHVRAFDVLMQPLPVSFYAYDPNFAGGVYVAAGRS